MAFVGITETKETQPEEECVVAYTVSFGAVSRPENPATLLFDAKWIVHFIIFLTIG